MKNRNAALVWLALLPGIAAGADEPKTQEAISRDIAYTDVLRAQAYKTQAEAFVKRAEFVGPGQEGSAAAANAAKLLDMARQSMRDACNREPYFIEKGAKLLKCSEMQR